jgi:GNAT superfamily N-acetyltransferase
MASTRPLSAPEDGDVSVVSIRPYRSDDRSAVRQISCDTAFMGRSLEQQYRDNASLADLLTAHYTDHEPENALVAEHDGEVIGYLLSCRDARRITPPGIYALKHILTRAVCLRPGTARFYFLSLRDLVVDVFCKGAPKIDYDFYPCHTHSNFKPGSRGGGVGTEMFYRLFDHYKRQGVRGMHAHVMEANTKTLRWAEAKLGYRCHGEPYPVPGLRSEQGGRMKIQMIIRELDRWEPGGWREPGFKP